MTPWGYDAVVLPAGVRSRMIEIGTGLNMHVLEAGFEAENRPCVVLLHGFPELAYSWRKVMPALAAAGFHVVAPDQRGYGRTSGSDDRYDGDVASFHLLNLVADTMGLLAALRVRRVAAVVGHDFGSPVAAWCALTRPDVFRSVVLLSAPFGGAPRPHRAGTRSPMAGIADSLAALHPPRKHYQWYYSTRAANDDMSGCKQGIHAFLRAYRNATDPHAIARLQEFSSRRIDVPCCFIAGKSDWGAFQSPGALHAMSSSACTEFRGIHFIEGAGHWVQQEQPAAVSRLLIEFLNREA